MGIQEVQGAKDAPAYQEKKRAGGGEGFQESLLQNLKSREQEEGMSADASRGEKRTKDPSEAARIGVMGSVRINAAMLTETVQTTKVRHMCYEESDNVEIAVTEGYTLKGKRLDDEDISRQAQANDMTEMSETEAAGRKDERVYVEVKYEDGRTEAYQVNVNRVSKDTTHVIERFALETMQEV